MIDTDRITGAAKELGGKARSAAGDLAGSGEHAVEGRLREAEGRAETLYGQAKDAVRHAAHEVSDFAEDAYGHADDAARQGRRAVRHRIEQAPLASLLVAGLLGYGLALLLHSRA